MGDQGEADAPAATVVATYRQIASRFGLGSADAARLKARRAGWRRLPANHPLDLRRVEVPADAWAAATIPRVQGDQDGDQAPPNGGVQLRSTGAATAPIGGVQAGADEGPNPLNPGVHPFAPGDQASLPQVQDPTNPGVRSEQSPGDRRLPPDGPTGLDPGVRTDREPPAAPPRLEPLMAQLAALLARLEAQAGAELAGARAEATRLRDRLAQAEADRDRARDRLAQAEREAREAQAAVAWWTAGGPLRRAWRGLVFRRR